MVKAFIATQKKWEHEQASEMSKCDKFLAESCGCTLADGKPCSTLFPREYFIDTRVILSRNELDMFLLGSVVASVWWCSCYSVWWCSCYTVWWCSCYNVWWCRSKKWPQTYKMTEKNDAQRPPHIQGTPLLSFMELASDAPIWHFTDYLISRY